MNLRKTMGLVLALVMMVSVLAACNPAATTTATTAGTTAATTAGTTTAAETTTTEATTAATTTAGETTVPAEKVTLKFMCPAWDVNPNMNDWWLWEEYEKMTNTHIEWEEVAQSAMAEKKSTLIVSGDLPDGFWQYYSFSPAELAQYGAEGLFVSIDDKMDKAPYLSAVMDRVPSAKGCMTMPDGHIYAFPYIMEEPAEASLRYYVNKKYLENAGLQLPNTLEEFEVMLKAFKDEDVNGNGDVNDEFPIYVANGAFVWTFETQMLGAYGLGSNGLQQANSWAYNPGDDQLKFIFTDDKLKELWTKFNAWWEAGYIHPETFTGYDYAKWVADGTNGLVGVYSWVGANFLYETAPKDYVAINQLQGPYSQTLTWIDPPARGVVNGIITSACENVDRAISWFDYWYSEEGSIFGTVGVENETYVMKDGKYSYSDEILNYEGGVQLGAFQRGLLVYGGFYPYIEPPMQIKLELQNKTFEDLFSCTQADVAKYLPTELWPNFIATTEEQEILDQVVGDLSAYIAENRTKFITGELSLDTDWDKYVSDLESMGLADFMQVRQAQYDRYKANQ